MYTLGWILSNQYASLDGLFDRGYDLMSLFHVHKLQGSTIWRSPLECSGAGTSCGNTPILAKPVHFSS